MERCTADGDLETREELVPSTYEGEYITTNLLNFMINS